MATLSLEEQLKRIIYLNNAACHFFVGDPDTYQLDISEARRTSITQSIENKLQEMFSVLDAASADKNLPRRSIIFLVLGKLMHWENITPELKSKITAKVLELCQSDEEFFCFIKYYTQLRRQNKMPSSVEKLVRKFYMKKTPLELAQSVAKFNGLHKWSHKDLIKLAHVKSDTPLKNVVINYILTRKPTDKETEEQQKILDIIKKSDELRSTQEPVNAIPILSELKLTIQQVSPSLRQNGEIWAASLENMSIQEILPCLGKLYKLGLLKPNTTVTNYLTNLLTDSEKIKASGVHPVEVFTFMKRLEKGGKPMDPKLLNHLKNEKKLSEEDIKKAKTRTEAKCSHILSALLKCFNLACSNVPSTNKRYFVTIDVTEKAKNALCTGNKVLTLLEAAVVYTILLLRVEKDVVIATYKDDKINLISVEKKISFSDLLEKVKAQSSEYSLIFSPIEWATSEKKHVDVFVNFIHNDHASSVPKEKKQSKIDSIIKYRTKVNLPKTKLINFAVVNRSMPVFVDKPPSVLDILGFDVTACKVAECFSRGSFC